MSYRWSNELRCECGSTDAEVAIPVMGQVVACFQNGKLVAKAELEWPRISTNRLPATCVACGEKYYVNINGIPSLDDILK